MVSLMFCVFRQVCSPHLQRITHAQRSVAKEDENTPERISKMTTGEGNGAS